MTRATAFSLTAFAFAFACLTGCGATALPYPEPIPPEGSLERAYVAPVWCLEGGLFPPQACTAGIDTNFKDVLGAGPSKYVVCRADCHSAWISVANDNKWAQFYALDICLSYGYTHLGASGGTGGLVCGIRATVNDVKIVDPLDTSCVRPGTEAYDWQTVANDSKTHARLECSDSKFGPDPPKPVFRLCGTVMFECLR